MFFPDQSPPLLEALRDLWAGHAGIFIGALLTSLLLTPVFRSLAIRLKIYDMPDRRLKPHGRPIPYLGGLAIFLGVLVPLAAAALLGHEGHSIAMWAFLAGMTIIVAAGLLDDVISLTPKQKIIAQIAAALVLAGGGIIFRGIPAQYLHVDWLAVDSAAVVALGIAFQVALVVGACNATNLLDGLDGLCSGVTAIIAVGFLLLATSIAGWSLWGNGPEHRFAELVIVISLALLGAAIGFLPYNFNPASIFMGDAGSMLLGFVCATLIIMFGERVGLLKWTIGALFIFGLPIFDTSLAFVRRWRNGRPIFKGDRSHFYDQLVDRGLTVKQAVLVCYGLALFFVAMGVGIIFMRTRYGICVYLGVCAILAVAVYRAGMLQVDPQGPEPVPDPADEQVGTAD